MDHPSRLFCAALLLPLLGGAVMADAAAAPPRSGVGAVSLEDPLADTSLEATADRLAARIESAAGRPSTTDDTTTGSASNTPIPAPRPGDDSRNAAVVPPTATSATGPGPISISQRFGQGLTERSETRNDADASWWESPEARIFGFLGLLAGAAVVARRMARRGTLPGASRPSGVISVMARYPFGRGASLTLIECGPRIILLHQHGGRGGDVTAIAEFTDREELAELRTRLGRADRNAAPGFEDSLQRNLGRYDRKGRPEGFGQLGGIPLDDVMETVDLTRRRPRRGARGG
ncbi:MAG: FliO/MopB family protein [Phycisphaera sp.]|nr:FliO/MopB family protein [Phycisphaera sp.]